MVGGTVSISALSFISTFGRWQDRVCNLRTWETKGKQAWGFLFYAGRGLLDTGLLIALANLQLFITIVTAGEKALSYSPLSANWITGLQDLLLAIALISFLNIKRNSPWKVLLTIPSKRILILLKSCFTFIQDRDELCLSSKLQEKMIEWERCVLWERQQMTLERFKLSVAGGLSYIWISRSR